VNSPEALVENRSIILLFLIFPSCLGLFLTRAKFKQAAYYSHGSKFVLLIVRNGNSSSYRLRLSLPVGRPLKGLCQKITEFSAEGTDKVIEFTLWPRSFKINLISFFSITGELGLYFHPSVLLQSVCASTSVRLCSVFVARILRVGREE
jgi:hypothetical protein